jgi:hypothetical protein
MMSKFVIAGVLAAGLGLATAAPADAQVVIYGGAGYPGGGFYVRPTPYVYPSYGYGYRPYYSGYRYGYPGYGYGGYRYGYPGYRSGWGGYPGYRYGYPGYGYGYPRSGFSFGFTIVR